MSIANAEGPVRSPTLALNTEGLGAAEALEKIMLAIESGLGRWSAQELAELHGKEPTKARSKRFGATVSYRPTLPGAPRLLHTETRHANALLPIVCRGPGIAVHRRFHGSSSAARGEGERRVLALQPGVFHRGLGETGTAADHGRSRYRHSRRRRAGAYRDLAQGQAAAA